MENINKEKLLSPFSLLNEALGLYKSKLWILIAILLVPTVLNFILALSQPSLSPQPSDVGLYANLMFIAIIFVGIFSVLVSAWAYLALIFVLRDKSLGFLKAYGLSKNKLPSYILVNILITVATLPGIFLLGIPAIVYLVWFTFSSFVLVVEDYRGSQALMRSREYVAHRWWEVAWRMFFIILFLFAIQFIGSLLAHMVETGFSVYPTGGKPTSALLINIIRGVISSIVTLVTVPLSISYSYLLYLNLRETRPDLAKQPVNEKYKWFYILSPTTILIIVIVIISFLLQIARFS